MTLRCLEPLALKFDGQGVCLEPGACFTVNPSQAARIVAKFPGKVEVLTLPLDLPLEPLMPGWLVCYRDRQGRLCGGCDDRQRGTVASCDWNGSVWMVTLTNGQQLPLSAVRSVAKTDDSGRIVAAWATREHGYDGAAESSPDGEAVETDRSQTFRPGDSISWSRGGVAQNGVVDFTHTAENGSSWLFTVGPDWAAVNAKFATATPAPGCFACGTNRRWISIHGAIICGTCHPPADGSLVKHWIEPEGFDVGAPATKGTR